MQHIQEVNRAFLSIDQDRTVCMAFKYLVKQFGSEFKLTFAIGEDQTNQSIPEVPICQELRIKLIDGLGDKIQSSYWLVGK